ncbi:Mis12-Mtw1 protein family-domain-containing protein [Mycena latifolia]|nr:Mis12-Mtw1 protein family-domain-containing protein [Mycena latifolia]
MASNPLLAAAAAKKTKNKRKYPEETPGGLLIVRAPSTDAPTRAFPVAGPSKPRAQKKFKADALAVPTQQRARNPSVDPAVEQAVRDMEDETDRLRPASRPNASSDSSSSAALAFRPASPAKPPPKPARAKKKDKAAVVDTVEPLRDGTPQAARNKLLRADSMAAIARDRTPDPDTPGHRRRSSLGGRGKRISDSFQAGFALPHARVDEESFYKHVDRDRPEAEQLRQLLTWCTSRAAEAGPSVPVPPADAAALQTIKSDMVRTVADRQIDLSLYAPEDQSMDGAPTGQNAQNEKNKRWEDVYSREIHRAEAEREEWSKATYYYDAHRAKEEKRLEAKRLDAARLEPGKGKARAADADPWPWPDAHFLPNPRLQHALRLAQAVAPPAAPPASDPRLADVPFKLATLHTNLHAARTCARVAGRVLDARFGLLGEGLSRGGASGDADADASTGARGLMRALSRVDMARAPAMVGDAARRAAREVQRAVRAGEGERRVTLTGPVAVGGGTPRRPGTPRRERTPGRERERTPGR